MRFNKLFFAVSFITCLAFNASAAPNSDVLDLTQIMPEPQDKVSSGRSELFQPRIGYPGVPSTEDADATVTAYLRTENIFISKKGGLIYRHLEPIPNQPKENRVIYKQILIGAEGQVELRETDYHLKPMPTAKKTVLDAEKDADLLRQLKHILLDREYNAAKKVWKHYFKIDLPESLEPSALAAAQKEVSRFTRPNEPTYEVPEEDASHGASGLPFPTRPLNLAMGINPLSNEATMEHIKSMFNPATAGAWQDGSCEQDGHACTLSHPEFGTVRVSGALHNFLDHRILENDLDIPGLNSSMEPVSVEELEARGLYLNGKKFFSAESLLKHAKETGARYAIEYFGNEDTCTQCPPTEANLRMVANRKNALLIKYKGLGSPSGYYPYVRVHKLGEDEANVVSGSGIRTVENILKAFEF